MSHIPERYRKMLGNHGKTMENMGKGMKRMEAEEVAN
jgi:hypothetical protein